MKGLVARWLGAGLAGVLAGGCASPTPTLVKDPAQRFDGRGFSVTAPPGSGWYVAVTGGEVRFVKRLGDASIPAVSAGARTTTVRARPASAEDLVTLKERATEALRQKEPASAIELRDVGVDRTLGVECVRWEQEEVQGTRPNPASRSATVVTTTRGLDCLHPFDDRSIVTVGYREQRIKGATSLIAPGQPLGAEGEAFVRSIRFTPPR